MDSPEQLASRLTNSTRLWLFLDYDGTLSEFAPTPDFVTPDAELIELFKRLADCSATIRIVVVTGRSLRQIEKLLPVAGIRLAATYGVEVKAVDGSTSYRLDFPTNRPVLDNLKPQWQVLIQDKPGFFLEDKGWSLALHARYADKAIAQEVIRCAREAAEGATGRNTFRLLTGDRFLEIAPAVADKGQTVAVLLDQTPWPGAEIYYFGDDERDEEAFKVIKDYGGKAVLVSAKPRPTYADERIESPRLLREWLTRLVDALEQEAPESRTIA